MHETRDINKDGRRVKKNALILSSKYSVEHSFDSSTQSADSITNREGTRREGHMPI